MKEIFHSDEGSLYEVESIMAFTYSQWQTIYDFLKHEYIPYENLEMLALMKLIRQFLDENQ